MTPSLQRLEDYAALLGDLKRHPRDAPSIGLLLYKTQNRVIAEYALRGMDKLLGIASYQLADALVFPDG